MKTKDTDLICFSHLRWSFVFQRPQHLMSRFARERNVYFFEEPVLEDGPAELRCRVCPETGVRVFTPVLPRGLDEAEVIQKQKEMLHWLLISQGLDRYILWYYTPMALGYSNHLRPDQIIYDCMDELSAFAGAPPAMKGNEVALLDKADLIFTGGKSLYRAKRQRHQSVYLFPSSVDVAHFQTALDMEQDPEDQRLIPHPRIGYAGVIDERMDLQLLSDLSAARRDWHFVLLGPVVKINPDSLPKGDNLHYLGLKKYGDLPAYFSGWKIGMLPFALNESTQFISPTKTPEYLAAGLSVLSTPIADVVSPYGAMRMVKIARNAGEFISYAEELLANPHTEECRSRIDDFLSRSSWDKTWTAMKLLMKENLMMKEPITMNGGSDKLTAKEGNAGVAHV